MVYNFNPGPATVPPEVMAQAQAEFSNYRGLGYGIAEASHRAKEFDEVMQAAEANIRQLAGVSDDYAVLFLQGGASTQFAMIPMNLQPTGSVSDYADTGTWSRKAITEAELLGRVRVIASGKDSDYASIPDPAGWDYSQDAAYLHMTSNNTIAGTQYHRWPTPPPNVPLIADMSSDILARPLEVERFGLIYAGAQKNLGVSGVTLAIIRRDLAERTPAKTPTMLRYATHIDKASLFNTPPTFAIYMLRLATDWVREQGGLAAMEQRNLDKANALYGVIDEDDFYRCPVAAVDRSIMNVVWRLPSEELENQFLQEAGAADMIGLKGHRSVGGIRASIYNAMSPAGVEQLVAFMRDFRQQHG